jgi:hypothetical protein
VKKTGFALALAAMLAVPTGAMAAPTKADTKAASKTCHEIRAGFDSKKEFREAYGKGAFGKCVRQVAKDMAALRKAARQETREECAGLKGKDRRDCVRSNQAELKAARKEARRDWVNAAKTCRELEENDASYGDNYGTGKNAFGKCVSEHAKAQNDEENGSTE